MDFCSACILGNILMSCRLCSTRACGIAIVNTVTHPERAGKLPIWLKGLCQHADGAATVPEGSGSAPDVSAAVVARHPVKFQVAFVAVDSLAGCHLAVAGLHDLQVSQQHKSV